VVTLLRGTVLERDGSVYRVATEQGIVRAVLRGKAKRGETRVVVGDHVRLDVESGVPDAFGISLVEERHSLLARRVPDSRGTRPVAANVDEVLVVTATIDPLPIPQLIDRLLVVAAANDLAAAVVLNKTDLDPGDALAERFQRAGYPVFRTSVRTGAGLELLKERLAGRVTVVAGPSGAGKSSLLNALEPGLELRTGEISARIKRGAHTTVSAVMVPVGSDAFIVDTPGFSDVGLWGIDPGDLPRCFPELQPLLGFCRYPDCRHMGEPGCAVTAAVERGEVSADRMESYRVLLAELEDAPRHWE
jgi:ribosome biogenesis GTPase